MNWTRHWPISSEISSFQCHFFPSHFISYSFYYDCYYFHLSNQNFMIALYFGQVYKSTYWKIGMHSVSVLCMVVWYVRYKTLLITTCTCGGRSEMYKFRNENGNESCNTCNKVSVFMFTFMAILFTLKLFYESLFYWFFPDQLSDRMCASRFVYACDHSQIHQIFGYQRRKKHHPIIEFWSQWKIVYRALFFYVPHNNRCQMVSIFFYPGI